MIEPMTDARRAEIEAFVIRQRLMLFNDWEIAAHAAIRDLLTELRRREAQIAWVLARLGQIPAYRQSQDVVEAVAVLRGTADAILAVDTDE